MKISQYEYLSLIAAINLPQTAQPSLNNHQIGHTPPEQSPVQPGN